MMVCLHVRAPRAFAYLVAAAYGDTHLICSCDSVEDYAGTDDAELKISGGVESNT